jgi:hypothetical protein
LMFRTNRYLEGELSVHFFSPFIGARCTLVANAGKSRVLRVLRLFAASPSIGSSTQKMTIFPFLFVLSTRFAFQVLSPVVPHNRSMRLNFQPITKFNASLERKVPSNRRIKIPKGISPPTTEKFVRETKRRSRRRCE